MTPWLRALDCDTSWINFLPLNRDEDECRSSDPRRAKAKGKTPVEIGDAGVYVLANRKLNPMTSEQKKANREKQVFIEFINASRLPIDLATVENRSPPEPDILCRHEKEGLTAFELVELCERQLAWNIKKSIQAKSVNAFSSWSSDPCKEIIIEKMSKMISYTVSNRASLLYGRSRNYPISGNN